jgi:integrase/recombinase XerD
MKITGSQKMNVDLLLQYEKLVRYDRSGSYQTKRRREQAFTTFLNFVSEVYHKRKISNIDNRHIAAYVRARLSANISVKTIKVELSAIRHYLDLANAHVNISNDELGLQNLPPVAKLGASEAEIARAMTIAKPDISNAILLMKTFGLRENEAASISCGQLKEAVNNHYLRVKGKGGRIRNIPVETKEQEEALATSIQNIGKFNGGLLDPDNKFFADRKKGSVLKFKRRLSQFWVRKQEQIADPGHKVSNHDLRRSYAQKQFDWARNSGYSKEAALGVVSAHLGHGYQTKQDRIVGTRRKDISARYVANKH